MPPIRFHDLRRTHATMVPMQRVHPKMVSERPGHATVAMTLDGHGHVVPAMQDDAASVFDELLFGTWRRVWCTNRAHHPA